MGLMCFKKLNLRKSLFVADKEDKFFSQRPCFATVRQIAEKSTSHFCLLFFRLYNPAG